MLRTEIKPGERWWGGAIHHGSKMPLSADSEYTIDLARESVGNQSVPFFVSTAGRYIWSEDPFTIRFSGGFISADGDAALFEEGRTLAETYRAAMNKHFPPTGDAPDPRFYRTPQYNTWAELTYNQSQSAITAYADAIVANGYTPGILMIDDTWQAGYGIWRFNRERFDDARAMVAHLHKLGFTVMVWIVPYLCADSPEFREAEADPTRLLRNPDGSPVILRWWNGYSAALDMTSAGDVRWLHSVCDTLIRDLGVDGFKCDGGSIDGYPEHVLSGASKTELTAAWNRFALSYKISEVKDTWKAGGLPFNQRLRDKDHAWDGEGLSCVIPDAITASLTGHAFLCPDMVGGGSWICFVDSYPLDQDLIVRFAQASALFPAMQFSVAPWRILSPENASIVRAAQDLHVELGGYITEWVERAAQSGEPILRPLAYDYPDEGFETVTDEFLLGTDILVAPVLEKAARTRRVRFPSGVWESRDCGTFTGPCNVTVDAPLSILPWFTKKA
ncbi:MAG: glycoside hydrolase family 31 protein [Clostridiaceae bacterium]|nr:glycoside hydrolase family 31 protein [Clostridiaceae bacterium]